MPTIYVKKGAGDWVAVLAKPAAQLLKMGCLNPDGTLKADSACAKRRDALNGLGVRAINALKRR
jgi:hypothetical protein